MKETTPIKYTLQLDLVYNVLSFRRGEGGLAGKQNGEEMLVQILAQNKLLEADYFFSWLFPPAESRSKTKQLLV